MKSLTLSGLFPAVAVPFRPDDDRIVADEFRALVREVGAVQGVGGVVVNGHAGEVSSLTSQERTDVILLAREETPGDRLLVSGIEASTTEEAVAEAAAAKAAGADALLVVPPFDRRGRRNAVMDARAPYEFFAALNDGVDIPLIVFEYPTWSYCHYSTDILLKLSELPNVIGVKDGSGNATAYCQHWEALNERVSVLAACDAPDLFGMMAIGAHGSLIGISQVATPLWASFVTDMLQDRLSEARTTFVTRLLPIMHSVFEDMQPRGPIGFTAMTKEALRQLGRFSSSHVRRPDLDVTEDKIAQIRAGLQTCGLLTPQPETVGQR